MDNFNFNLNENNEQFGNNNAFSESEEKQSNVNGQEIPNNNAAQSNTENTNNTNTYSYSSGYTPSSNPTYSMRGVGGSAYSGGDGFRPNSYNPAGNDRPNSNNPSNAGGIHTTYYNPNPYSQSNPNGYYQQNSYSAPVENKPKKEKKKLSGTAKVSLIILACMIFSLLFGVAGAVGYNSLFNNNSMYKGGATISVSTNTKKAEDKTTDGTVAGAANLAKDSVVEITTESVTTSAFFGQYVTSGAGSGVIIDAEKGYIITCAHVVEGATSITVTLTDGNNYEAKLVGSDTQTDIAVVSIDSSDLELTSAVVGNSDNIVVGETAIAIGNPLGTLGGTVSSGIISALDREITIDGQKFTLLQIDTSINPGNSGGGLFDIEGNLIGIVNAKSSGDGTSTTIEGLGFAIPINKAIDVATQLTEQGYVSGRVKLGIQYYEVTTSTNTYSLYQQGYGDLVNYITDYGVYFIDYTMGQSGDLLYGDRIVAIDGTTISTASDIASLLEEYSVGDTVKVTVSRLNSDMRRSQMVDVDVTLIEYVPETNEAN